MEWIITIKVVHSFLLCSLYNEGLPTHRLINISSIIYLLFIAGMLLGIHYETIIEHLSFCPVPIVCGANRLGKTKSSKAALALVGNTANFYSAVKERFSPRLCSRSTLRPVLDDVKSPKLVEEVAISFFNKGKDGSCLLETEPRTCPMLTVNWPTLEGLNKDQRYRYS
jgi:hypothetical protein